MNAATIIDANANMLTCPICLDDVNPTINCIITECGHKFHAKMHAWKRNPWQL
jgi:hypothetical protein